MVGDKRLEIDRIDRHVLAEDLGLLTDQRLLRQHVETGRAQLAACQRPHQRLRVDHIAARGIDEDGAVLHNVELPFADHPDGVR